jgi:putative DNA methylase
MCDFTTRAPAVRAQLKKQRGGAKVSQLLAVLVDRNGSRVFRSPSDRDDKAVASSRLNVPAELPSSLINPIRPHKNTRGISAVTRIGIERFEDLYTDRQLCALQAFSAAIKRSIERHREKDLDLAALTVIGLSFGRLLHQNCSSSRWLNRSGCFW